MEAQIAEAGGPSPSASRASTTSRWVLMDYGDFVVHVFLDETRRYDDLERLWTDVTRWSGAGDASVAAGRSASRTDRIRSTGTAC